MKVGQFSDSFLPVVDGVGRVVVSYCETLGKKGVECSAIAPLDNMGYIGNYPFEIIEYYSASMLPLPSVPTYNVGLPSFDPHYHKKLNMKEFDIVHVHTPFIAGIEGINYARKHNIPVIGTFHSKYYDDFFSITGSKHLSNLGVDAILTFYNQCDEVWTVSENSAETLRSYGYIKDIKIVPNGSEITDVPQELGIKAKEYFKLADRPTLIYVGQQNWKKNIGLTLEACSLLKKEGQPFTLLLVGKGPHEKEIAARIQELGIQDEVIATGHITDPDLLNGLYKISDFMVFPSVNDTFSMVVREAANAATASIVVKGTAPSEPIVDNVNGLLIDNDVNSLYETLSKALKNPEKIKELGLKAKETIPIPWDKVIDDVIAYYQFLIEEKKAERENNEN